MGKKIIIRILAVLLIVVALNFVYKYTLFPSDMNELCEHLKDMKNNEPSTDILYLSESSNFNTQPTDSIQNSISEITNFFFPKLKIYAVNQPASHAGIYRHWLNQIDLKEHKPKAIVVTLNMRSFDAAWIYSKAESSLQESIALMRPYPQIINRFLLSLNAFYDKTDKEREYLMLQEWRNEKLKFPFEFKYKTVREWDDGMAQGTYLKPDGTWDLDKIRLACHYIKAYAFQIKESNVRIKDFDFIASWCSKNKIPLYYNLMAENIQYSDSLVGKELVFLMKQNRDFLVKRYSSSNCTVVDNLEAVNGKEFTDQTWTTEHYAYRGRMIIAKNLAEKLKNQFNNEYKKAY